MSEECDGRACRGPCVKDDCLLLRLTRGRPPMDGDEAPVSEYVNGGITMLDLVGWLLDGWEPVPLKEGAS